MIKIIVGVVASAITLAGVLSLFVIGAVGQASEWCVMECGSWQTCGAPFSEKDVCGEIDRAATVHGASRPLVWIRWRKSVGAGGKRSFRDRHGRDVAGVPVGSVGMEVAYIEGDAPCDTALAHEVEHRLMMLDGVGKDPEHRLIDWTLLDGCK